MEGMTEAAAGLLERAVCYGLESVEGIRQSALSRPTPCAGWDLKELLCHVNESLAALHQGADGGRIDLSPSSGEDGPPSERIEDLVAAFREGAQSMLDHWSRLEVTGGALEVAGHPIASDMVAIIGAVEIAVHGWDICESRGRDRPIPARLALEMLRWIPLIIDNVLRHTLFAAPVPISPLASPSDRLVAFLGRSPRGRAGAGRLSSCLIDAGDNPRVPRPRRR
jgi:uncharacterized protein (TIGR03086 family)